MNKKKMNRICFFMMSGLPIPAVQGGAIETLLQLLIDQNEIQKKYRFVVLCNYDIAAEERSKDYKYTRFVYFKKWPKVDKVLSLVSRFVYRGSRISIPHTVGCYQALRFLKKHSDSFDFLINETWKVYLAPCLAKVYPKERIAMHIHRKGEVKKGDISNRIDNSCGYIIAVSNYIAEDWCENTGRSNESAFVLMNCCNKESIARTLSENEKVQLRKSLGIKDNERVIIFAGRVTVEKGVIELIKALDKITEKNVHFLLVGGNNNPDAPKTDYEKRVNHLIMKSKVPITRTGYVDNDKLYQYYCISDISVLPSMCPDAAPLTVIEAMTAGMPIVTTRKGGIPEYACDAAAIFLEVNDDIVDSLAEAINRLLSDDSMRAQFAEASLKQAELYSPERYYLEFSEMIEKMKKR